MHPSGKPQKKKHRKHFPTLWSEFKTFFKGREAPEYVGDLSDENPFADWFISDRYSGDGFTGVASLDRHREAARKIRAMVDSARQDGTP